MAETPPKQQSELADACNLTSVKEESGEGDQTKVPDPRLALLRNPVGDQK